MSFGIATQIIIVAVIVAVVAVLLRLIRNTLAPRSLTLAGIIAVSTAIFLGQVATWYVAALATPSIPIALLSGFVGMLWVQPDPWSVTSLCRCFALVSTLVTAWAVTTQHFVATSLSLLVTVVLLYVSYLASRLKSADDTVASGA